MSHPYPSPQDCPGAVEPGFADLPAPAFARGTDDVLDSGARALLQGRPDERRAALDEQLPPGRATRPGEH
jgi:hypothetical protein